MEKFKYEARDRAGNQISGFELAEDKNEVINILRSKELFPINIQPAAAGGAELFKGKIRIKEDELVFFTRQLADLIESNLPLPQAINLLKKQTNNLRIKTICSKLYAKINKGGYLWEALSEYPSVFSAQYIGMVKAAEMGADMSRVLDNLAAFLEKKKEAREAVVSMLLYPMIVFILGIATVLFLIIFIVPKMVFMFESQQISLPLITRGLISMSRFLAKYWIIIAAVLAVVFFAAKSACSKKNIKKRFEMSILKLPFVSLVYTRISFSRFCYILGLLLSTGMQIIEGLTLCREILALEVFKDSLSAVISRVRSGDSLSNSMSNDPLFPAIMVDMIAIGEQTGKIEHSLQKIADSFDKQLKQQLKSFLNVLEPLIILFIALLVGMLVTAVLLPIFQFNLQTF